MSIEGLTKYLMSDDNLVITPERFIPVHQDMTAPLSHYFINSSHNTYLTGSYIHLTDLFYLCNLLKDLVYEYIKSWAIVHNRCGHESIL